MAEYYVVRDKNTGLYFRGKGVNRWGKYYNQASIYRIKANAENTIKEVSWRGEQAEIVPIQIVETTEDVVPRAEVEELSGRYEDLKLKYVDLAKDHDELLAWGGHIKRTEKIEIEKAVAREIFEDMQSCLIQRHWNGLDIVSFEFDAVKYAELKKKHTESEDKE